MPHLYTLSDQRSLLFSLTGLSRSAGVCGVIAGLFVCQVAAQGLAPEPMVHNMSPLGFVSAINTPVATVLPMGSLSLGLVNNNPEIAKPGVGGFGSLSAGLGLLQGLEAFGRLSFAGDLQCNLYGPNCTGTRDLSVSAKYQLLWVLPLNTRLAGGFTDFGGAATNYRSQYVVATSDLGPVDVSLGFARKGSPQALLDGPFGSLVLRVTDQVSVQYENDSRAHRLGTSYVHPLSPTADLLASLSRQTPLQTGRESTQLGLHLVMHLGQRQTQALKKQQPPPSSLAAAASLTHPVHTPPHSANAVTPPNAPVSSGPSVLPLHQVAKDTIAQLERAGFTQVQVSTYASKLVHVQAEPTAWRQSRTQAMGVAIQTALQHLTPTSTDPWLVTLTFQGQPVLSALTSPHCAAQFKAGFDTCADQRSVTFFSNPAIPVHLQKQLQAAPVQTDTGKAATLTPQFELGVGLKTAVGTEYGLADYSMAAELSAELALRKGLGLQATASTPLAHSEDFGPGGVFSERRHRKSQMEQALLTYWQPLGAMALQATAGYINHTDRGGQLDAVWHSEDGLWRASGLLGKYTNTTGYYVNDRMPALAALRYSVMPALWQVELTAGQFYNMDRGWSLASNHWMGDTRVKLYYRRTGLQNDPLKPVRSFAGIELSLPLGPARASTLAGFSVRGVDRWQTNLETKMGERDNILTQGYGQVPRPRHGLMTDVIDFDRSGSTDIWADRDRVRLAMRSH